MDTAVPSPGLSRSVFTPYAASRAWSLTGGLGLQQPGTALPPWKQISALQGKHKDSSPGFCVFVIVVKFYSLAIFLNGRTRKKPSCGYLHNTLLHSASVLFAQHCRWNTTLSYRSPATTMHLWKHLEPVRSLRNEIISAWTMEGSFWETLRRHALNY